MAACALARAAVCAPCTTSDGGSTAAPTTRDRPTAEQRFWRYVDKTDACWVWTGGKSVGYGCFHPGGSGVLKVWAHRWAYEHLVGPIPEGFQIDHLCRNRACVNPAHLEPVTQAENIRRGAAGRHQSDKTHCPKGHPYDEANTYYAKRSGTDRAQRVCRTCAAALQRAWWLRKRAG